MTALLGLLLGKLFALLLVMLAGAGLSRFGLVDGALRRGMNRLLFYFVIPVMVFTSMRGSISRELLATSYWPIIFGIGLCLLNMIVALSLSAMLKIPLEKRRLFAFLNMFGNNIYLGIPIALALFGPEGVAIVLLYSLGSDLILWSLGVYILSPERKLSLRTIKEIFTPTLMGLILGSVWGLFAIGLPTALADAAQSVGTIASPLALLLTGAALAEIDFGKSVFAREIPALVVGKLIISPLLALMAVRILGLPLVMSTTIVIVAGMPTFVRSIVLTDQLGWDGQQTAMGVLVTTLVSFITVPLILHLVG